MLKRTQTVMEVSAERGNRENSGSDVSVQHKNENEKTREREINNIDC